MLTSELGACRAMRVFAGSWSLVWGTFAIAQTLAPPNIPPPAVSRATLPISYGKPMDNQSWSIGDTSRISLPVSISLPTKPGEWVSPGGSIAPLAFGLSVDNRSWNLAIPGREKLPVTYGLSSIGASAWAPIELGARPIFFGKPVENTGDEWPIPGGP
jgi:hypothetical protein